MRMINIAVNMHLYAKDMTQSRRLAGIIVIIVMLWQVKALSVRAVYQIILLAELVNIFGAGYTGSL